MEGRDAPVVALLDDQHREAGGVDALERPGRRVEDRGRDGEDGPGGELTRQVEPELNGAQSAQLKAVELHDVAGRRLDSPAAAARLVEERSGRRTAGIGNPRFGRQPRQQ